MCIVQTQLSEDTKRMYMLCVPTSCILYVTSSGYCCFTAFLTHISSAPSIFSQITYPSSQSLNHLLNHYQHQTIFMSTCSTFYTMSTLYSHFLFDSIHNLLSYLSSPYSSVSIRSPPVLLLTIKHWFSTLTSNCDQYCIQSYIHISINIKLTFDRQFFYQPLPLLLSQPSHLYPPLLFSIICVSPSSHHATLLPICAFHPITPRWWNTFRSWSRILLHHPITKTWVTHIYLNHNKGNNPCHPTSPSSAFWESRCSGDLRLRPLSLQVITQSWRYRSSPHISC